MNNLNPLARKVKIIAEMRIWMKNCIVRRYSFEGGNQDLLYGFQFSILDFVNEKS
jgi:hypothetical protein